MVQTSATSHDVKRCRTTSRDDCSILSGTATRFLNMTKTRQDVVRGPQWLRRRITMVHDHSNFAHSRWSYDVLRPEWPYNSLSPSHTGLTTMLRPSCDLKLLESWEDRRLSVRLVAEVVGDRGVSWVIVDDRASKIKSQRDLTHQAHKPHNLVKICISLATK